MKFIQIIGALITLTLSAAHSQVLVHIPASQTFNEANITLHAWMFGSSSKPQNQTQHATVIMLHGCGGAYDAKGKLSPRMIDYARLLNDQGWHALVLDSFSSRGAKQICTQPYSKRQITPKLRAQDVLDAHLWLTHQLEVDKDHIAYLGWSNGGSTVLAATNLNNAFVFASGLKPAGAAVFYPGCVSDLKMGYRPNAQVLIQIGESDDWTHPGPCKNMAAQSVQPRPEIISYAGAYHQFDSEQEIKIRYDVGSGQGVHYGGNLEANQASKKRLIEFFKASLSATASLMNH